MLTPQNNQREPQKGRVWEVSTHNGYINTGPKKNQEEKKELHHTMRTQEISFTMESKIYMRIVKSDGQESSNRKSSRSKNVARLDQNQSGCFRV